MKKYLYSDETLFRNRDLFEIDYIPEEFNYRESQLKDIAFALQPGLLAAGRSTWRSEASREQERPLLSGGFFLKSRKRPGAWSRSM
jgi:hypothetical protein